MIEDGGPLVRRLMKCLEICKLNAEMGSHVVLVVPCESVAKDVCDRLIKMEGMNIAHWEHLNRRTHTINGAWDRHLHLRSHGMIDLVICGQEDEFCTGLHGPYQRMFHPGVLQY